MLNVLSLFDGLGGAREALKQAGIDVDTYYASEIDKYAISVCCNNHPDVIQVGSVVDLLPERVGKIDLLIGGSPCQDLSIAKRGREGLQGDRSGLFWHYVRLLETIKPKYFILENVASMKNTERDKITEILGVEPILINSNLVTALNRPRLYWTNIKVTQPEDQGLFIDDILMDSKWVDAKYYFSDKTHESMQKIIERSKAKGLGYRTGLVNHTEFATTKFKCLDANYHKGCDGKRTMFATIEGCRMATPNECEWLQGLPGDYTAFGINDEKISDTQRYRMLGNGFTIPVISHILRGIKDA